VIFGVDKEVARGEDCNATYIENFASPNTCCSSDPSWLSKFSFENSLRTFTILQEYSERMIDLANLPIPHPRQLPSGDDIRRSKSIIEQLDRTIEDLEQDIRQLQTRLQEVQQKRTNYASYISTLRRLPTEVLSEIILKCLQNEVDITVMAGISSRLREVALGMAGIWSNISLRGANHSIPDSRLIKRYGSSIDVSC
jgi:hypothetical protein